MSTTDTDLETRILRTLSRAGTLREVDLNYIYGKELLKNDNVIPDLLDRGLINCRRTTSGDRLFFLVHKPKQNNSDTERKLKTKEKTHARK